MTTETTNVDALREQLDSRISADARQLLDKIGDLEFSERVAESEHFTRTLAAHLGDTPGFWLTVRHIHDTSTDRWDGCCSEDAPA